MPSTQINFHYPRIDGLRGVAIIAVIAFHFLDAFFPVASIYHGDYHPLRLGWAGVDLFFVISGFLITRILLTSRQNEKFFLKFYFRRSLRIFPLYYLFLFFFFFIFPLLGFRGEEWRALKENEGYFWLYGVNYYLARINEWPGLAMSHLWSLSIEEQFYLFWPLVIRFIAPRSLPRVCWFFIVTVQVVRIFLVGSYGEGTTFIYTSLFTRMDCLIAGALLAVRKCEGNSVSLKGSLGIPLCLLIWIFVFQVERGGNPLGIWTQMFGFIANCYGATLLVNWATEKGEFKKRSIVEWMPLRLAGKYCYFLYLAHPPLLGLTKMVGRYFHWGELPRYLELTLISLVWLGVCSVLAWVSWNYFEYPLLKLSKPSADFLKGRQSSLSMESLAKKNTGVPRSTF